MVDSSSCIALVQIIEQYPVLYDYTRSDYSNRNVQDKAWEEISKTLKISGKDIFLLHIIHYINIDLV